MLEGLYIIAFKDSIKFYDSVLRLYKDLNSYTLLFSKIIP